MLKTFRLVLLFLAVMVNATLAGSSENYIKFQINDRTELAKLTRTVSIDNVTDLTVYAYAVDDQLRNLTRLGYTYEILPHPGTLITPRMATTKAELQAWDTYPTYSAYVAMMAQFAADYPGLCQIVNAGSSVEGRAILFARISDNVGVEEDEPEVMYSSSIHGDETAGYVLMLRLIDSLLTGYGSDSLITRLVDSCEIWINPLSNPDGSYAGGDNSVYGATRYNALGVDLNRNFPDPDDGPHSDGNEWQTETMVMMNLAAAHSYVIAGNFHGGAEVINYPWDTWSRLHPDNDWYVGVCRQYADSAQFYSPASYLTDLDDGITNGFAWYEVQGGRQDYMNYWHGCREVTMEISQIKLLPADQLPAWWTYNRVSFLDWLEQALYGIRGLVTDAVTGDPVFATIRILGLDTDLDSSRVFTDPDVGDYHRMIEAGTYSIEFRAAGYYTDTLTGVVVSDGAAVRADIALTPLPLDPVLHFAGHDTGFINPGDSVSAYLTLLNDGLGNATGVNALLSTSDSYITVIQPNSAYPNITASGDTGISLTPYLFAVSSSCPLYHQVLFHLEITADGGYTSADSFYVTVGQIVEDFESGGLTYLPWDLSGGLDWIVTDSNPFEGIYCAQSGPITDGQITRLSLSLDVSEAGDISFRYRVSSEQSYDYLRFYIDDVQIQAWSGEIAWAEASFAVEAGARVFAWEYSKDGSVSGGQDRAWVDKIIFPPIHFPDLAITTADLPDWTVGLGYSQQLEASDGIGSLTWMDQNGNLNGTGLSLSTEGLISGLPVGAQAISLTAKVTDGIGRSDQKVFDFVINPALTIMTLTLPEGNVNEIYSQQLLADGGTGTKTWSDKNGDLTSSGLTLLAGGQLSGTVSDTTTIDFIAVVTDGVGAVDEQPLSISFIRPYICGDANGDSKIDVGDAVFLINYIFRDGMAPDPLDAGLANGDDLVNIGDAVYLINYIFRDGDPPICP